MSVVGKRTQERDAALAELERLREIVRQGESPATAVADEPAEAADSQDSEGDDGTDDGESMDEGETWADAYAPPPPKAVIPASGRSTVDANAAPRGRGMPIEPHPPGAREPDIDTVRREFAKQARLEHERLLDAMDRGN